MANSYPPDVTSWVPGQRVDAEDLNQYGSTTVAWGYVDHVQKSTDSALATGGITDIPGLSITFTAVANRFYKVSFNSEVVSDTNGDRIQIDIADGTNTRLTRNVETIDSNNFSEGVSMFTVQSPAAGSVTYKVRGNRLSGAGACVLIGSASGPANTILVEDIGPTT